LKRDDLEMTGSLIFCSHAAQARQQEKPIGGRLPPNGAVFFNALIDRELSGLGQ
jgi:hypothetical protein